jgi:hypothetical protein
MDIATEHIVKTKFLIMRDIKETKAQAIYYLIGKLESIKMLI